MSLEHCISTYRVVEFKLKKSELLLIPMCSYCVSTDLGHVVTTNYILIS